jgi:prevent-host-death family protein
MMEVKVYDAKAQLSELIDKARRGEDVVITRYGKPVAKIVAVDTADKTPRKFGRLRGKVWISEDFNDPLPDDIQALFEGRDDKPW